MSNATHGAKSGIGAAQCAASSSQSASSQNIPLPSPFKQLSTTSASTTSEISNPFDNPFDLSTSQSHVRDFARQPTNSTKPDNLDLAGSDDVAQNELLRDVVFPEWGDDATANDEDSPEEMQKKDPLGTQGTLSRILYRGRGSLGSKTLCTSDPPYASTCTDYEAVSF